MQTPLDPWQTLPKTPAPDPTGRVWQRGRNADETLRIDPDSTQHLPTSTHNQTKIYPESTHNRPMTSREHLGIATGGSPGDPPRESPPRRNPGGTPGGPRTRTSTRRWRRNKENANFHPQDPWGDPHGGSPGGIPPGDPPKDPPGILRVKTTIFYVLVLINRP